MDTQQTSKVGVDSLSDQWLTHTKNGLSTPPKQLLVQRFAPQRLVHCFAPQRPLPRSRRRDDMSSVRMNLEPVFERIAREGVLNVDVEK